MRELTRTNDPILISWLTAELAATGIEAIVLDTHTSIVEGSISAIPRRVMVADGDLPRAQEVVRLGEALRRGALPASDD